MMSVVRVIVGAVLWIGLFVLLCWLLRDWWIAAGVVCGVISILLTSWMEVVRQRTARGDNNGRRRYDG
jgi:hypothetical protein